MSKIAELNETVELKIGDKSHAFPVITGSEEEKGIDISALRGKTGYVTLDPGFKNTGSCSSAITFLDGENGILRYRGYSIEELSEKAQFVEVAYLLIYGELPNAEELAAFRTGLMGENQLHHGMQAVMDSMPDHLHPMGMAASATLALSGFNPDALEFNEEDAKTTINRLMGKFAAICGWIYRKKMGLPYLQSDNRLPYVERFLQMMFGERDKAYNADPIVVEAINILLILHADHEQNCSTSTVRVVGSSHANLYASIAAGITALWGPRWC